MSEWIKVVFDGIGTELISLFVSFMLGGVIGFRIGKHTRKIKQTQKAGSNADQYQESVYPHEHINNIENCFDSKSVIRQSQKAKNNSKQTQIGE